MLSFFANEKNNNVRIIKEAIFVGLLVLMVGYISSFLLKPFLRVTLPDECKRWNQKYLMQISLFTTGFLLHIFLEISGLNKEYAKYRNNIK